MNRRRVADAGEVTRASWAVGIRLAIASGALVVAALGFVFFYLLNQLQPAEVNEIPAPGEHRIYVDPTQAMVAFAVVGILAIVVAGLLSVMVTRRAVRPLGRALQLQRDFVADASHELRTPLAVMDARIQVLQRGLAADDPSTPALVELRADTKTMIDVVNDLLLAADPERDTTHAPSSMAEPVRSAVASLRLLADEGQVELVFHGDETLSTRMPAASLQRCATALIDNALVHSPAGGTVAVTVSREGGMGILTVSDQGAGIRGIDPDRIFDRFARARTDSGRRARAGFGIGLALVREVVVRHGGDVAVTSTGPSGTVLRMRVPAA